MTHDASLEHPVALVVAVADNGVIGADGGLPWRLPEDLKYFKAVTMGKPIVMGRKTWDSLPRRPLPGRPNLVVTRQRDFMAEGAEIFTDIDAALARADAHASAAGLDDPEISVIGGAEIFRMTLPRAERLYLTEVHAHPEGDAFFPDFDRNAWRETARDDRPAAGDNPAHSFTRLARVGADGM
ncbi:dihydrofolate reductase [Marivibrio halodurans]|uniref:Dihydrofolate reductase n=1 Tax=Marivibrio halodurans TaxID=2039722 RepID=A0A8J7SIW8_9PROT|nr:dihydrofolate reductase [Marivibrio halodurans]MBP5857333.1 dihydrofolate reductase [Marivibrio halodurans]